MILCAENNHSSKPTEGRLNNNSNAKKAGGHNNNIPAKNFTFRELAAATMNFRGECLIGEGGFGRVYKGKLDRTNQVLICNYSIINIMALAVPCQSSLYL